MYEIYSNSDGRSMFIVNSVFGLNQCMDYLENKGFSVSYTTVDEHINPIENFKNVKRWTEV